MENIGCLRKIPISLGVKLFRLKLRSLSVIGFRFHIWHFMESFLGTCLYRPSLDLIRTSGEEVLKIQSLVTLGDNFVQGTVETQQKYN